MESKGISGKARYFMSDNRKQHSIVMIWKCTRVKTNWGIIEINRL